MMLKYHSENKSKADYRKSKDLAPVFIIGAGRSGTTLVYKLLCMHPNIAWISNYVARIPALGVLSIMNRFTLLTKKVRHSVWFGKKSNAYLSERGAFTRMFPMPVEGESVYARCNIPTFPKDSWRITKNQIKCLRSAFEKIRNYQKCTLVLSKRTANNRRLPQLIKAFPNARFIHVVRDGRAVANSLINVKWWMDHKVWWWDEKTPKQWEAEGKSPIALAAMNWVEEVQAIQAGLTHIPPGHVLQIRYEELPNNHRKKLEECNSFMRLKKNTGWLDEVGSITIMDNNLLWKNNLSKNEKEILTRIQRSKLEELEYIG